MGLARVFTIVVLGGLLVSCMGYKCQDIYPEDAIPSYDLGGVMDSMARELCGNLCAEPGSVKTLLVTDFVPAGGRTIERNGAYLGQLLRGSVIKQCCTKALRTDFVGRFAFSHDGAIIANDSLSKIGSSSEHSLVMVGSYVATHDKLSLIANLFDPDTGAMTGSASREGSPYCFMGRRSVWFDWKP